MHVVLQLNGASQECYIIEQKLVPKTFCAIFTFKIFDHERCSRFYYEEYYQEC